MAINFKQAVNTNHPLAIVGTVNAYSAIMAEKIGHKAIGIRGRYPFWFAPTSSRLLPPLSYMVKNMCKNISCLSWHLKFVGNKKNYSIFFIKG